MVKNGPDCVPVTVLVAVGVEEKVRTVQRKVFDHIFPSAQLSICGSSRTCNNSSIQKVFGHIFIFNCVTEKKVLAIS